MGLQNLKLYPNVVFLSFQAVALDANFLDAYINLGNVLKEARIFDRYTLYKLLKNDNLCLTHIPYVINISVANKWVDFLRKTIKSRLGLISWVSECFWSL